MLNYIGSIELETKVVTLRLIAFVLLRIPKKFSGLSGKANNVLVASGGCADVSGNIGCDFEFTGTGGCVGAIPSIMTDWSTYKLMALRLRL